MLQNFEIERRIGIILPPLGGQLSKFSLAESGVGARSFAGDPEGCCRGGGVAPSRDCEGSAGPRKQPVLKSYSKTEIAVKIQSDTKTTVRPGTNEERLPENII